MGEIVCNQCQKPIANKKDLLVVASGGLAAYHQNCAAEKFKAGGEKKAAMVVNSSYANKVTALTAFTAVFVPALLFAATSFLNMETTFMGYYAMLFVWAMFIIVGGLRLYSFLRFESKLK